MVWLWLSAAWASWTPVESSAPRPTAIQVETGLALAPGRGAPRLIVSCEHGNWSLRLAPGVMVAYQGLGDEWEEAWAPVHLGLDGGVPKPGKLRRSTQDAELWWPRAKKVLRGLDQHRTLEVRLTPSGAPEAVSLVFDIDGLADARAGLAGGCKP